MAFINPLDLQMIFVNTFAGSINLFIFIAIIFIAALSARFNMPNIIVLVMFGLFAIFLSAYLNGLYAFVVIVGGIAIFYSMGRMIKN